jgi:hypothetical protein
MKQPPMILRKKIRDRHFATHAMPKATLRFLI